MPSSYVADNESAPLYRFVSFFDLYEILVNRRLRFSKLATMSDKNEGVGVILHAQDDCLQRLGSIDSARILKIHESVWENHYISCWTMEAEAMSMWSLYSPDSASIRIATTVQKLNAVLNNLFEDMHWQHCENEPGTRKPIAWHYRLEPVEYINFISKRDEIQAKYRSFRDRTREQAQAHAHAQGPQEYYKSEDGFMKDWRDLDRKKVLTRDGMFLKDEAFFHEREVRACLYCGVRNDLSSEEWRKDENILKDLFTSANPKELPDFIYAKVDSSFIDSVCFDPRMPAYKRDVYKAALSAVLPDDIQESRCFGYVLAQDDFSSDYDGYPVKA